jgi:hypothetical protein
MVIKKIDGDQIYVDWDHRPWLESNFILNSEWGPTIEALAKENALPKIEKGVKIPPRLRDHAPPSSKKPPSKWIAFLKSAQGRRQFPVIEYPPPTQ